MKSDISLLRLLSPFYALKRIYSGRLSRIIRYMKRLRRALTPYLLPQNNMFVFVKKERKIPVQGSYYIKELLKESLLN